MKTLLKRVRPHDDAQELIDALGDPEVALVVANHIRDLGAAERIFLADYMFDILEDRVEPPELLSDEDAVK